jgi:hypothetical protein
MRKTRKPKTGRTADAPAWHPPSSLLLTKKWLATVVVWLFRICAANHGEEWARKVYAHAMRRSGERSIKGPSSHDDAVMLRYLIEREKYPQAKPYTLARLVAKTLEPEDVHPDRLRAATQAVQRVVDRYEKSESGYRAAMAIPDLVTVVLYPERVPPYPYPK